MASCPAASAASPHGRGQCGATRPASASWRPVGPGFAASHARTQARRSVVEPEASSDGVTVTRSGVSDIGPRG